MMVSGAFILLGFIATGALFMFDMSAEESMDEEENLTEEPNAETSMEVLDDTSEANFLAEAGDTHDMNITPIGFIGELGVEQQLYTVSTESLANEEEIHIYDMDVAADYRETDFLTFVDDQGNPISPAGLFSGAEYELSISETDDGHSSVININGTPKIIIHGIYSNELQNTDNWIGNLRTPYLETYNAL